MLTAENAQVQELPSVLDIHTVIDDGIITIRGAQAMLARYDSKTVGLQNTEAWNIATSITPLHILSHEDTAVHADVHVGFTPVSPSTPDTDQTAAKMFPSEDDDKRANKVMESAKSTADKIILDLKLNPWTIDALHAVIDVSSEPDFLRTVTPTENHEALSRLTETITARREEKQAQLAQQLDGKIPTYVAEVERYILPMSILQEVLRAKNTILPAEAKANLIERLANLLYVDETHSPQREEEVRLRLRNALADLDYDTNYMRALGQLAPNNLVSFQPKPKEETVEPQEDLPRFDWNMGDTIYQSALATGKLIVTYNPGITEEKFMGIADHIPAPKKPRVRFTDHVAGKTYRLPVFVENQHGQRIRPVSVGDLVRVFLTDPETIYNEAVRYSGRFLRRPKIIVTENTSEPFKPRFGLIPDLAHHAHDELIEEVLKAGRDILSLALPRRRSDPLLQGPTSRKIPFERIPAAQEEALPQPSENANVEEPQFPPTIFGTPIIRQPRKQYRVPTISHHPDPSDEGIRWDVGTKAPGSEFKNAN